MIFFDTFIIWRRLSGKLKSRFTLLVLHHEAYIQVCRGLMISSVCLGFFGAILALIGMKCTKLGGSDATKARLTVLSGFHYILSGKCLGYNTGSNKFDQFHSFFQ